jgi:hypothetical protein
VTAAPVVGLTLTQLALARGIAREHAAALVGPFVSAGLVEELDGVLVVTDPLVVEAFEDWESGL